MKNIVDTMSKYNIDCDFSGGPMGYLAMTPRHACEGQKQERASAELGYDTQWCSAAETVKQLPGMRHMRLRGMFIERIGGTMNPYKYVRGLLKKVRAHYL